MPILFSCYNMNQPTGWHPYCSAPQRKCRVRVVVNFLLFGENGKGTECVIFLFLKTGITVRFCHFRLQIKKNKKANRQSGISWIVQEPLWVMGLWSQTERIFKQGSTTTKVNIHLVWVWLTGLNE